MGLKVIVIPVYKKELDVFERVSLSQVVRILGEYPIAFVASESLEFDYGMESQRFSVERFPDSYFQSTKTYSELLLSPIFYERFRKYEYMLIYQLDAFVFSNRLEEFCDLGYDYIGAPIGEGVWKEYHVGNGGFSLRKISSALELLKHRDEIMENSHLAEVFWTGEDNFYAYCGSRPEIEYTVPSVFLAAKFSAQNDVGHGLRDIPKRGLPFGTHHWPTFNYSIWKPIIERYGYRLPDQNEKAKDCRDYLKEDAENRLFHLAVHYCRTHRAERTALLKILNLDPQKKYSVWGAGYHGKRCGKILKALSLDFLYFCDRRASELTEMNGKRVVYPDEEHLKKAAVFVAVQDCREMEYGLEAMGLHKGTEYFNYFEILSELKAYVKSKTPRLPGITCPLTIVSE